MEVADYNTDTIPQQTVAQLLAGNVVPGSVAQETANANSNTQVNQNYVGGTMYGTSYKSANNNARVEIFPSYDKTIGFVSYADNGNIAFETIIAGPYQGDVIIGNYAGGQGVKWDQSAGTLNVLGNITANSIAAGATITSPNITGGTIKTSASGNYIELNGSVNQIQFQNGNPSMMAVMEVINQGGAVGVNLGINTNQGAAIEIYEDGSSNNLIQMIVGDSVKTSIGIAGTGDNNLIQIQVPTAYLGSKTGSISNDSWIEISANGHIYKIPMLFIV